MGEREKALAATSSCCYRMCSWQVAVVGSRFCMSKRKSLYILYESCTIACCELFPHSQPSIRPAVLNFPHQGLANSGEAAGSAFSSSSDSSSSAAAVALCFLELRLAEMHATWRETRLRRQPPLRPSSWQ